MKPKLESVARAAASRFDVAAAVVLPASNTWVLCGMQCAIRLPNTPGCCGWPCQPEVHVRVTPAQKHALFPTATWDCSAEQQLGNGNFTALNTICQLLQLVQHGTHQHWPIWDTVLAWQALLQTIGAIASANMMSRVLEQDSGGNQLS
jgi:hypothetical protein